MSYELHCDRAENFLPTIADNSIDLIAVDPPYHRVKMNEAWDKEHGSVAEFIAWLDGILVQFHRILKPNGSLYLCASPKMSARVEVAIGERFNVLNRITWQKPPFATKAEMFRKSDLRSYFPASESIIFAEHYGADNIAKGEAGYAAKCDALRGFVFEPLRAYLDGERRKIGVSSTPFDKLLGTNALAKKYFNVCQWQLPNKHGYEAFQNTFNGYFQRPYEDLRTEYEELRTEYEELRRPFAVSADVPYTDVWTFPTVQAYRGKHVCEKPLAMMEHIVRASSKAGATVLDCFMGSGTTGVACQTIGDRHFIGCDFEQRWVERAKQRIEAVHQQPSLLEVGV